MSISFSTSECLGNIYAYSFCYRLLEFLLKSSINVLRQQFSYAHPVSALNSFLYFSYVKTWFFLDFLSSLPLNFIMMAAFGEAEALSLGLKGASRALKFLKVMKLLNLLKLLRLSRIMRGISQYEEVSINSI